jgi:APA family basic amino acid/polyamine antiporter
VPQQSGFKHAIGGLGYFALSFGAVVGSGWIVVLGDWLRLAGPGGTALGFLAGGATMALVAVCYGELSGRFPMAGGELLYTRAAFGERVGFIVGWYLTLYAVATCAFEGVAFGWLMRALVPGVALPAAYTVASSPVTWDALALSGGAAAMVGIMHLRGANAAIGLQNVITYGFIGVICVVIVTGLWGGSAANLQPLMPSPKDAAAVGVLRIFAMSAYFLNGWQVALHAIEERRSGMPVSRAVLFMVVGILIATLFYVAIVLTAGSAMPWRTLADQDMPGAAAFRSIGGPILAAIVIATAILSLLKTWMAMAWMASRLIVAQARDGFLPQPLARIDARTGAPRNAILFTTAGTAIGVCAGRSALLPIVNMSAICLAVSLLVCLTALILLRRREPVRLGSVPSPVLGAALLAGAAMIGAAVLAPVVGRNVAFPFEWTLLLIWGAAGLALSVVVVRRPRPVTS